jgi:type I restriction enzyme S subunit
MVSPERTTFGALVGSGALEIGDGYRAKNAELGGSGLPFLRQGLIDTRGVIDFQGADRFQAAASARAEAKASQPHDVLVVTKGWSTGRVAYVRPELPTVVYSPHVSYWRSMDSSRLDPGYLRQWSRSPQFTAQLEALAGTCTLHPYLSLANQLRLQIDLPPLDEQRRIAAVLGALDDKIELNRKMNKTLEGMAQATFKSWFIDFDGHDDLVDSEIGPVPKGWEVGPIDEITRVIGGGTPKRSEPRYWGGSVPWFSVQDAPSLSEVFVLDTKEHITEAGLAGSSARIVPAGTSIISARGTVGKLAVAGQPMAFNQSCYGISPARGYTSEFVYFMLRSVVAHLQRSAHGSVFDTITRATFQTAMVVQPPVERTGVFATTVGPLLKRIAANGRESLTLTALRDTLLPKLISGELRVPEAEALVEATPRTNHEAGENGHA